MAQMNSPSSIYTLLPPNFKGFLTFHDSFYNKNNRKFLDLTFTLSSNFNLQLSSILCIFKPFLCNCFNNLDRVLQLSLYLHSKPSSSFSHHHLHYHCIITTKGNTTQPQSR
ncbi:hypothetical protein RYX36_020953 [Vicia faba]